jgi:hypothetical protein
VNKEFGSVFFFGQNFATCWQKQRAENPTKVFVEKKNKVAMYQGPKKKLGLSDLDHTLSDVAII